MACGVVEATKLSTAGSNQQVWPLCRPALLTKGAASLSPVRTETMTLHGGGRFSMV